MATAGDPGREARADLNRVDPVHDLTAEGVSGDPDRIPEQGTAEVHSRITGSGSPFEEPGSSARERADRAAGLASESFDQLRGRAAELGATAGDWASRARRGVDDTLQRVEERFHVNGSGAVDAVRDNPILAVGLAFGVGFLLAGGNRKRSGLVGVATGQIRGALIGGLTATITQEVRELLDAHGGVGGILSTFGGRERETD